MRNILWRIVQFISKQGFKFAITIYSAALLPKADFDNYAYVIVIINLIIMFSDLGISSALVYKCKSVNKFLSIAPPIATISVSIGLIAVFIVFKLNIINESHVLLHALPLIIFSPIFSIFDGYFRINENFKTVSIITGASALISFLVANILIESYGIFGIIYSLNIQLSLAVFLLAGYIFYKEKITNFDFDWRQSVSTYKYSLSVGGASIAAFFYTKIDIIIMENYGLSEWNGTYELLFQFMTIATVPGTIVAQVLASRISKYDLMLNSLYYKKFLIKSPLLIVFSILFYLIVKWVISTYYPPYLNDITIEALIYLSILIPFKIWGVFQTQSFFVSLGLAKFILFSTIIAAFLNVILDLAIINKFGFIGVIYVTIFIHSSNILFQTIYLNRYLLKNDKK